MAQHLLLVAGAAPLLLLADPFAALLWALPAAARASVGHLLRTGTPARWLWRALTVTSVAWLAHVAAIWLCVTATSLLTPIGGVSGPSTAIQIRSAPTVFLL